VRDLEALPREEGMRAVAWNEEALVQADSVSSSDLDAHRHVLEMARTIEVLRRDYELMQSELSAAYAQLRECSTGGSSRDIGDSDRERQALGLRGDEIDCCSHQREVDELRKVVPVTLAPILGWAAQTHATYVLACGDQGCRVGGGAGAAEPAPRGAGEGRGTDSGAARAAPGGDRRPRKHSDEESQRRVVLIVHRRLELRGARSRVALSLGAAWDAEHSRGPSHRAVRPRECVPPEGE
jgi:hypothetical protein